MASQSADNKKPGIGFGLIFVTAGLGMAAMMLTDPSGLNAPMPIGLAATAVFALAGVSIIAHSFNLHLLAKLCGLSIVWLFVVIGGWIGFFADGEGCSVSGGLPFVSFEWLAGPSACNIAFSISAIVTLLIALAMSWAALRPARPSLSG